MVTINAPLHPETEHLFNDKLIGMMKRGSYLVNTARGKIVDRDAIVRALESGQLAGYAGDVWFPQPAPKDHPWRTMPHHGMTPHVSGTSLSAQARYAAGTREILESYFAKKPIRTEYLIVDKGKLAGAGAHSYTRGRRHQRLGGSGEVQEGQMAVADAYAPFHRRREGRRSAFRAGAGLLLLRALAREFSSRSTSCWWSSSRSTSSCWLWPSRATCRPGLCVISPASTRAPTHACETFLMLRDMQARNASVPSPYSPQ